MARATVSVEPVERHGRSGSWTEDEVTIASTRARDGQRSSTAFPRSLLGGTPVDVRAIDHFGAGAHLTRAPAAGYMDRSSSIEEPLEGRQQRELSADEFRRSEDADDEPPVGG